MSHQRTAYLNLSTMSRLHLDTGVYEILKQSLKEDELLDNLLSCLTRPPQFTTLRISTNQVESSTAVELLTAHLAQQCEETGRKHYDVFLHPLLYDCIIVRNRGPFHLNEQPVAVIVDLSCGMAVLRGAHVYKQGIMGAPHCLKYGDTVSVYADLDGKCLKGFAAPYEGKKLLVGNGISNVTRADIFRTVGNKSSGIGIHMSQPVYEAPSLSEVPFPWLSAQNLPSIVCVHVLDPQPGEIILDMCAAPGGKTTHIADLMNNQGRVVALEKSKTRTKKMAGKLPDCVEIYTCDSTTAVATNVGISQGPPYPPASFDRILLDAPCSALGQRPSYISHLTVSQLQSYPVIQHKLLLTAAQLLKPGGVLVYSTCTITREENEDQVQRLLTACPCLQLDASPYKIGGDALPSCSLSQDQRTLVQRFDPSLTTPANEFDVDSIGFFIAKFVKRKE